MSELKFYGKNDPYKGSIGSDAIGGDLTPVTKTGDYTVNKSTDQGKQIRIDSTSEVTVTLPEMTSVNDNFSIDIIKVNTGQVNIVCDSADQIGGSVANKIYNETDERYARIHLQYIFFKKLWVVNGYGTWQVD